MTNRYIGLMSGTSADGIDAVLVDFKQDQTYQVLAQSHTPFNDTLQQQILAFHTEHANELNRMGALDTQLGHAFAEAANTLLQKTGLSPTSIKAIGSHGQNIRHQPENPSPFTIQIGDPNIIASKTGIKTVADFRRKDIALGGQGAPLAPAFHQTVFQHLTQDTIVLNIGGIANITFLPKNRKHNVLGFDTGPGNALMDAWTQKHLDQHYDESGAWASTGKVLPALLSALLTDAYFKKPAPKSTGRAHFNLHWLTQYLKGTEAPEDVQATLLQLTAESICNAIKNICQTADLIICGGGVHNKHLVKALSQTATIRTAYSSKAFGVDPDTLEAVLFAWLAKQTLEKAPGNLTDVTGATKAAVLGGIYFP